MIEKINFLHFWDTRLMNFVRMALLITTMFFTCIALPSHAQEPAGIFSAPTSYSTSMTAKERANQLTAMKNPSYRFPRLTAQDANKAKVSHSDLNEWLVRLFSAADRYIATLNKRLDETQAAAKSCDRAKYDASLERLIDAYVSASLYLRRKMDNIDALAEASGEFEENYDVYRGGKRAWSLFWAAVHDNLGNGDKIMDDMIAQWEKDRTSSRYMSLGQAYHQAYGDMLHRMEQVLKTADYPPFKDCDEPDDAPTLADATAALAEAMNAAVQNSMDHMAKELSEIDELYKKIDATLNKYIDDAASPTDEQPREQSLSQDETEDNSVGQLPILPDPKQSHDGSFQTPDFGNLVVTQDVEVDVPDTSEMEAMLQKTAERMKGSPLAQLQENQCDQNPKKVCEVLLKNFRKDCERELKAFYKICKKGPSITDCKKRCQANWQQGVHELAISELAKKHIKKVYGASENQFETDYLNKEGEIENNTKRIEQIKDAAKNRVIHIYINTNTDTIIRHNGNKFEPKPPLRYSGTEGHSLNIYERNEIEYLKARNKQLRDEMKAMANSDNNWLPMALDKWSSGDGICQAPQNDANRDACMAECSGRPAAGVTHACYSSLIPQLVMPYGRSYLYPPGHPDRDLTSE